MKVKEVNIETWKTYVEACETATFFHTYEWYWIWEAYAGHKPKTLLFEFSSGRTALLPFSEKHGHRGLSKIYDSSPSGTYGGPLFEKSLDADEEKQLYKYLDKLTVNIVFNPYDFKKDIIKGDSNFTQLLALNDSFNFRNWDNYNWQIKKSGGLTVKFGKTKDEWKLYFCLYEKSLIRWGDSVSLQYSYRLFKILQQLTKECKLVLVFENETLISGGVYFIKNKKMIHWHGAGDEQFFHLLPTFRMHDFAVRYAIEQGYNYYDFNPSGGHKGVVKFKENFNPKKVYFRVLAHQNRKAKILGGLRKMFPR